MVKMLVGEQLAICKKCHRLVATMPMADNGMSGVTSTAVEYFGFESWSDHAERCNNYTSDKGWSSWYWFISYRLLAMDYQEDRNTYDKEFLCKR